MAIFGSSKKSPTEIVKHLKELVMHLENPSNCKKLEKTHEEILKLIGSIKAILFSQTDSEQPTESVLTLCREIIDSAIIDLLLRNLQKLDFESKKEFVLIFGNLMRKQVGGRHIVVEYLLDKKELIVNLLDNYSNPETSLNIGTLLRETIKYKNICVYLLTSGEFFKLFSLINDNSFDVGSDAYLTFKEIVTRHKQVVAEYLEEEFEKFFQAYNELLTSENYVTKRQSMKLLGELLVERLNYKILVRYVSNPTNLKLVMTLLKDKSANVQFEAFHVFKIFVVNPNRSPAVTTILCRNKKLLIDYLSSFHEERKDDDQFVDEKEYVIRQIKEMKEHCS